jgi:hypothetical protein
MTRVLKDKDQAATVASSLAEAGLESFEVVEVHRSELKGAPYNPRKLSDTQRKKLQAGLKRHGLVSPPTWNVQTGFIVGGHQRISVMDSLMRTQDYRLKVARIDVSVAREKELNILLNNTMAQGEWDVGALMDMFKDESIQVEGTGFDLGDVYQLMGETPFETRAQDASRMAEQLDAVKGLYDTIKDRNQKRESSEYYTVLVFKDEDRLARFIKLAGLAESRYQNGEKLAEAMGLDLDAEDEPAED